MTTPPWRPGPSICNTLPDFHTVDTYPIRSPIVLADYVLSIAQGRNVVEIGTRNGDVSACIANFTHRYVAVEMERPYCESLKRRGIEVLCKDWNTVDMDADLPLLDVILWWVWPPTLSERWLRQLWQWRFHPKFAEKHTAAHRTHNTTVLIVYDGHIPEDMRYLPLLAAQYNGHVDRLFFDEGGPITSQSEPSYAHPNLWRPGRWGVLHVARFDLGPHSGPLPSMLPRTLVDKIFQNVRADWDWPRWGWRAGRPPPISQATNGRGLSETTRGGQSAAAAPPTPPPLPPPMRAPWQARAGLNQGPGTALLALVFVLFGVSAGGIAACSLCWDRIRWAARSFLYGRRRGGDQAAVEIEMRAAEAPAQGGAWELNDAARAAAEQEAAGPDVEEPQGRHEDGSEL